MNRLYILFRPIAQQLLLAIGLMLSGLTLAASPLDINTATADQFAAVMSGVGLKKAQAIVAYRDNNGPFVAIDDLVAVKGIGAALLERNRDLIQVVSSDAK
ncbi:helix-hairpin-helix domain-containing protein [Marinomonas sp. THO17]|uniref:ComEA family DNA-binding protein n=1 Tax=Marinomonas sp. THO17 TaxID=3149048 RepID=UPI00336BE456